MTNFKFDHSFADLERWKKHFVGFEKFADSISQSVEHMQKTAEVTYPPFNLKKVDEDKYVIEVAVAGFGKNDIELTLEENKLLIKGQTTLDTITSDGLDVTYLHKGIADRAFTRTFTLADNVIINNAQMVNGLLKVWLEHIIPESKKPKKIDIEEVSGAEKTTKSELLTESK